MQMDQLRQNGAFEDESIVEKRSILSMTERNSGSFGDVPTKEKRGFGLFLDLGKAGQMRMSLVRSSGALEDESVMEKRCIWL